jgi:hypothetical protein
VFIIAPTYTVIDIGDPAKNLAVVCEATSRKEVTDYLRDYGLAKCDVFKEAGEETYRGICKVSLAISGESKGHK